MCLPGRHPRAAAEGGEKDCETGRGRRDYCNIVCVLTGCVSVPQLIDRRHLLKRGCSELSVVDSPASYSWPLSFV